MKLEAGKEMDRRCVMNWLNEVYVTPNRAFCDHTDDELKMFAHDALALLKEQEEEIENLKQTCQSMMEGVCLLKEQKWIPVTERLPKSMINRVLVYVQHEDLTGYIGFGHFEKFKGEEMWYDLENNCQFSMRGYTVTHWMETPIPPMEGR